ncbi:MAG: hypothetical protein IH963_11165 [Chloroflexi bacterium]|nr:hypothetical protein [Chloroflexota bacterium]MCH8801456.1 hypothetical protein [Chloroflexota bacterium]MCH8893371.1 hypothetical protein [Chloroflexota bacterium]MCH9018259.1 hypothetical protein [Chloroflexota bacterium]MCI0802365.1 hypothetical protein [Chloroflexota bacterium]
MFQLLGLVTLPLRLALKLIRLPLTIMSCITKLGCLLVVIGIPVVIVVVIIYLT